MAVTVQWYDDDEDILHYIFDEGWDWNDYEVAVQQGRWMMRQKPYYVGILNDMQASDTPPHMIVSKAKRYIETRPANTGLAIFVSRSVFFKVIHRVLVRVSPRARSSYFLMDDLGKAVKSIKEWLKQNQDKRFDVEANQP